MLLLWLLFVSDELFRCIIEFVSRVFMLPDLLFCFRLSLLLLLLLLVVFLLLMLPSVVSELEMFICLIALIFMMLLLLCLLLYSLLFSDESLKCTLEFLLFE